MIKTVMLKINFARKNHEIYYTDDYVTQVAISCSSILIMKTTVMAMLGLMVLTMIKGIILSTVI